MSSYLYMKRSHGKGDVGHIAHFVRQQLKVNDEQFAGLRDRPLSRDQCAEILRNKGVIPSP
jgi:hypothetical protein